MTMSPGAIYDAPFAANSVNGANVALKGDFNMDGIPDILLFASGTSGTSLMTGSANPNATGTFTPGTVWTIGHSASYAIVGDFNNDGLPDVALVIYSTSTNYGVSVYLNN